MSTHTRIAWALGIALLSQSCSGGGSEAFETARIFVEHVLQTKNQKASARVNDDDLWREVMAFQSRAGRFIDVVHGVSYDVDSEEASGDGNRVDLTFTQHIRFDPPGTHSAMGAKQGDIVYEMTMERGDDAWWVTYFTADIRINWDE